MQLCGSAASFLPSCQLRSAHHVLSELHIPYASPTPHHLGLSLCVAVAGGAHREVAAACLLSCMPSVFLCLLTRPQWLVEHIKKSQRPELIRRRMLGA